MKRVSILVILLALLLTACIAPMATDMATEEGDASAAEAVATEEPAEESAADEAEASTEDAASRPSRLTGAAQDVRLPFVAGNSMVQGQKYPSESGNHYLIVQPDGNLVVYTADDGYVWGLGELTREYQQAQSVQLENDGNFVVRGADDTHIWSAANEDTDPSAILVLEDTGNLRLVSYNTGQTYWSSDAVPFDQPAGGRLPLTAGQTLTEREKYFSESGNHYLVFQTDGNLVVYTADDKFVWGLNEVTDRYQQARTVQMQTDGNLVARGENDQFVWSALDRNPDPSASLKLTPEGVLQLVGGSGDIQWSSDGDLSGASAASTETEPAAESSANTCEALGSVTPQDPGSKPTTDEVVKDPDPMQGFLRTLNSVRCARGLDPMQFDDSLTQACQWLADVMVKHDKLNHSAVSIGGSSGSYDGLSYTDMNEPWDRTKHFGFKDKDGIPEAAGMSFYEDVGDVGGGAVIQWASSNTHYRPFLSRDGQVYSKVGFGYGQVGDTDKYYTCAVFGNPAE